MKKASILLAALVIIFSSCSNGTSTTPAADTSKKMDKKRDTVAYADSTIQPHGPDKQ